MRKGMGDATVNKFAVGVVSALVGATCWGFSGTCMQFLFQSYDVSVMFVAFWRMAVAGVLLTAILLMVQREQLLALLHDGRSMLQVCVFGLIGLFFCQLTYMLAIDYTNAGTATVLQAFNVVFVLCISCIGARRAPRPLECLAVCMALTATVLIATKGDLGTLNIPLRGLFWGLVSAAAVCFYVCYPKKLFERWGSPAVTALGMCAGGVIALVPLLVSEFGGSGSAPFAWVSGLDATGWLFLAIIALVGTLASFGLYLYGVSIVGSVRGSLLGTIEPAAATVIAAVWLSTAFTWADWVGMVLMIATVFVVTLQPQKD